MDVPGLEHARAVRLREARGPANGGVVFVSSHARSHSTARAATGRMTRFRFFGVAAYEIVTSQGQHILMDPFLDENPGSPVKSKDLERVDLIIVSHAAMDHLGDTEV